MPASLLAGALMLAPFTPAAADEAVAEAVSRSVVVLTSESSGSGVSLGGQQFLTAAHVVEDASAVSVVSDDGRFGATVAAVDRYRDLALLTVAGSAVPAITMREEPVPIGAKVYAIGAPMGDYLQVSSGIASALVRQNGVEHVQTDAPVNPGNSGGPLVDQDGRLVGIVVTKSATGEGIGFATAMAEVRAFLAAEPGTGTTSDQTPTRTVPSDVGSPDDSGTGVPWLALAAAVVAAVTASASRRHRRGTSTAAPVRLPPLDLSREDLSSTKPEEETQWTR